MSQLHTLPAEIVLRIFEHSDGFAQVVALASTCKRLRSVADARLPNIIWDVGRARIPGFADALMAVRATAIVQEHFQNARLPPHPFPLASITGRVRKPSLDELESVFALQHLARCLEDHLLHATEWSAQQTLEADYGPQIWTTWRERLHTSLYRLFLAGAALCGLYHEPFLGRDPQRPPHFLDAFKRELAENPEESNFDGVLCADEFQYLLQFPVYNFEAFDRHDAAFGALAEFLVQVSQSRPLTQPSDNPGCFTFLQNIASPTSPLLSLGQAERLFNETTQLLAAYEQVDGDWMGHESCFHEETAPLLTKIAGRTNRVRKATIVKFGSFCPIEVTMPACITETRNTGMAFKIPLFEQPSTAPYLGPLDLVSWIVYGESGQPNSYTGVEPTPAPPLQFFHYVYRKYLGLRFSRHAFELSNYAAYPAWIGNAGVFSERFGAWGGDLEGMFVAAGTPMSAHYRRYS